MSEPTPVEPAAPKEAGGTSEPTPVERAALATRELRRARARRILITLALWVGCPTLLAVIYYGVLVTPQYESVAVVCVDSGDPTELGTRPRASVPVESVAIYAVQEHILSRAMIDKLASEHKLLDHYAGKDVDWWSRLSRKASKDKLHDYYLDKVSASMDGKGATLSVHVRAFSADGAREFASAIVASAEQLLADMSARSRQELTTAAERRVSEAEQRLTEARAAGAPAGGTEDRAAAAGLAVELARDRLNAELRGLELVQAEAARRQRHLVVVAAPSLPDKPSFPRRLWSIATVFLASLALTGIIKLLTAATREHAQI